MHTVNCDVEKATVPQTLGTMQDRGLAPLLDVDTPGAACRDLADETGVAQRLEQCDGLADTAANHLGR